MSSRPKVSINIPDAEVEKVRGGISALVQKLIDMKAYADNQSRLYRAMANANVLIENGIIYVKFPVGEVKN